MTDKNILASFEASMAALKREVAELNIVAQKVAFLVHTEAMINEDMQLIREQEHERVLMALMAATVKER